MQYELKVLEHIITIVLNPNRITEHILTDEFISECKLHIENEKERIRNQFRIMVFGEQNQSILELYYRKHLDILIQLADISFNYLQPGKQESIFLLTNNETTINFYREIAGVPNELLDFIEISFPEYFYNETKIPESKRWLLAQEIKDDLKGIQTKLEKSEVNKALIKIACRPFEDLLLPGVQISYNTRAYLQELKSDLLFFTKKNGDLNANEALCRLLVHINFNSIHFLNYYIQQLQEIAKGCNTLPDLIEYFSLKLKIINQLTLKQGLIYKPGLPPIKEQIGSWICEELYYLEKKGRFVNQVQVQHGEQKINGTKVHTRLSVSQLAMAVKLLMEAKLITNKNSSDLIRMVAKNFRTDRQEVISEESLRNKLYNFESATVTRLKDEIIGLMNLVRKY